MNIIGPSWPDLDILHLYSLKWPSLLIFYGNMVMYVLCNMLDVFDIFPTHLTTCTKLWRVPYLILTFALISIIFELLYLIFPWYWHVDSVKQFFMVWVWGLTALKITLTIATTMIIFCYLCILTAAAPSYTVTILRCFYFQNTDNIMYSRQFSLPRQCIV